MTAILHYCYIPIYHYELLVCTLLPDFKIYCTLVFIYSTWMLIVLLRLFPEFYAETTTRFSALSPVSPASPKSTSVSRVMLNAPLLTLVDHSAFPLQENTHYKIMDAVEFHHCFGKSVCELKKNALPLKHTL